MHKKIILASASPRRKELLAMAGYEFDVECAVGEEDAIEDTPDQLVETLSYNKAMEVAAHHDNGIIIGADTVVAIGDMVLGKPEDKEEAYGMIASLSDTHHSVFTGVTVIEVTDGEITGMSTFSKETKVYVRKLTPQQIEEYVSTSEPYDKAGSYAIQGIFSKYIEKIEGDYANVVGLPVCALCEVLEQLI